MSRHALATAFSPRSHGPLGTAVPAIRMDCDVQGRSRTVPSSVFRPPPSVFRPPSSAFRLPPSAFRLPPSAFRLPPSAFRLPPSVFRPPSSVLRPPSSVLRRPPSVFRPPPSVLRPPSSVLRPFRCPRISRRREKTLRLPGRPGTITPRPPERSPPRQGLR
jgi:hypothetical protein